MQSIVEINYEKIEENSQIENVIHRVIEKCFLVENLTELNLYISITLTIPEEIKKLNREYRKIDKETDVLSFPMFEKEEITQIIETKAKQKVPEVLGDIIISVQRVEEQAKEYGHSFERELAYMLVHGFYHLMGYDHIEEEDKKKMRPKEEFILEQLNIVRK